MPVLRFLAGVFVGLWIGFFIYCFAMAAFGETMAPSVEDAR